MKLFIQYSIILLLFIFVSTNLQAVQSTCIHDTKAKSSAKISVFQSEIEKPKSLKRKSKLKNIIKENLAYIFSKGAQEKKTSQDEKLETVKHELAIASLVFGIASFPGIFLFGIGFLFGILALIFGLIARKKINKSGGFYTGEKMAKAGITTGTILLASVFLIAIVIIMNF